MADDERAYLRFYIAQLVRIWTALSIARRGSGDFVRVLQDLCSDKLRIMLHELANKKNWTLGFSSIGIPKHERLFARLVIANKWFEGYTNQLHYRNCSGAHLQRLDRADHMFQRFGYGGKREWRHLTNGVAASVAMMKLIDGKPYVGFWRKIRARVRGTVDETFSVNIDGRRVTSDVPIGAEALLQSVKWDG